MDIKLEKMFSKSSTIGAERTHSIIESVMHYWIDSLDEGVRSTISFRTGAATAQSLISPAEARELAEHLNAHADEVEALQLAVATAKEAA